MKLNYRDKVILVVAIVILAIIAGVFLFIKPAIEDVNKASDTLTQRKSQLVDLNKKIKEQEDLPQRIDKAYKEATELASKFYDFQSAQSATHTIDKLLEKAKLENTGMSISAYSATTLSPYAYVDNGYKTQADQKADDYADGKQVATTAEGEAQAASADQNTVTYDNTNVLVQNMQENGTGDVEIGVYNVDFTFTGSMDNIKKFCQNLVTDKSLIISSLSIPQVDPKANADTENGKKTDEPESTVSLQMVVLKKLADPNKLEAQNK